MDHAGDSLKGPETAGKMFGSLGAALRLLREQAGVSQAELARRAQIGKSQLSQYERGNKLPTLAPLGRLITALETTPLVIFYVISVIERASQLPAGFRIDLLDQGAKAFLGGGDGEAHHDRHYRHYRELFDRFLLLFESAVEAQVIAALARAGGKEET